MASRIGTSVLHSTAVGKAYLAALAPDAEPLLGQIGYERQTPQTIADAAAAQAAAGRARLRLVHGRAGERAGHPLLRRGGARCRWPARAASASLAFRQKPDIQASHVRAAARAARDRPAPGRESQPGLRLICCRRSGPRRHRLGLDAHGAQHAHDQAADADQCQRLRHLRAQHRPTPPASRTRSTARPARSAGAGWPVPAQRAQPRREQADGGHQRQEHFGARAQRHGKGVAGRRHAGPSSA